MRHLNRALVLAVDFLEAFPIALIYFLHFNALNSVAVPKPNMATAMRPIIIFFMFYLLYTSPGRVLEAASPIDLMEKYVPLSYKQYTARIQVQSRIDGA